MKDFVCFVLEIWCCKCNTIEMRLCNIEGNHGLYMITDWSGGKGEASIVV